MYINRWAIAEPSICPPKWWAPPVSLVLKVWLANWSAMSVRDGDLVQALTGDIGGKQSPLSPMTTRKLFCGQHETGIWFKKFKKFKNTLRAKLISSVGHCSDYTVVHCSTGQLLSEPFWQFTRNEKGRLLRVYLYAYMWSIQIRCSSLNQRSGILTQDYRHRCLL